jgi:RNA polymerase sigma-70 factor, ECF subfamily
LSKAECQGKPDSTGTLGPPQGLDPETLVRSHASAVLGICLAHTRNVHDGEDMMQEVFVKAVSRLRTLRDPSKVRQWILQIARRTCIDHYRRQASCQALPDDVPAPVDETDSRIASLHSAVSKLPDLFREPISLYYLNGQDCAGVARTLGISEAAVRSRLARARLRLHEILSEDSR